MSVDYLVITISVLAQWRIAGLAIGRLDRRFPERPRLVRGLVLAFELLLVIGYLCTWAETVAVLRFPALLASLMGACTLAYLGISAGILAIWLILREIRRRVPGAADPGRREALNTLGNALIAAPFAAIGYGFVNRLDFHVREVDVPIPGLHADLDGVRILQLSDIHLSPFLSERDLARVVDAARGLRPHLAVVTGDLISERGDPLDACIRQLARLKSDAGVLGCMGNHERYARVQNYAERAAARAGIRFLRLAAAPLRFGAATLNVAGVDHQSTSAHRPCLVGAERLVLPDACNVLLSHNPDVFPQAARQGYNFVLSGHTHGGQVTVEILDQAINPARFFTPYVYGLYREGNASAYVTRGIGTIGIPARIGAPPEISVLRLRKA